jgi:polyisoprenoid-binding protein YceI
MLGQRLWFTACTAICFTGALPFAAAAQTNAAPVYPLSQAAGVVDFTVSARMVLPFKREGRFTDFTGQLSYDAARPGDTRVDLTVFTSSVDMKDREQADILRSPDFFDVDRFPTMHFASTAAAVARDGKWMVTGDLTIRGITKHITVPVRLENAAAGGQQAPVFETTFQIDRTDFGLNGTPRWGGVNVSIGRNVQIHIAVGSVAGARR